MSACSPGANEANRLPTSSLPSMPSDGTQVLPSACMQVPLVHAAAKLLQSSLVLQDSHACVPISVWIWLATCDLQEADDDALGDGVGDAAEDAARERDGAVLDRDAVLDADSPVVLVVLSTVNARSDMAFIVGGVPWVVSMVMSQAPMSDAVIGSGLIVLTITSVDRCSNSAPSASA